MDAIVAEAEELAEMQMREMENQQRDAAVAKKKTEDLEQREQVVNAKQAHQTALQAEIDHVEYLEAELYQKSQELRETKGLKRKDLKAEVLRMDAAVKKARGEMSNEAKRLHTKQCHSGPMSPFGGHTAALFREEEDDKETTEDAEAAARAAKAEANKKRREEQAACMALRKQQEDDRLEKRAREEESRQQLQQLRAQSIADSIFDEEGEEDAEDLEHAVEGELVSEKLEEILGHHKAEEEQRIDEDGFVDLDPEILEEMRVYQQQKEEMEAQGFPTHESRTSSRQNTSQPPSCKRFSTAAFFGSSSRIA